jgi:hypothetical protein
MIGITEFIHSPRDAYTIRSGGYNGGGAVTCSNSRAEKSHHGVEG